MRDSVPSASYSSVCNVLRQWNIPLIPTYRVYRLYDRVYRLYDIYIYFNKMKKEVGMLLQKRTDTSAVGIYKLYEENTH